MPQSVADFKVFENISVSSRLFPLFYSGFADFVFCGIMNYADF